MSKHKSIILLSGGMDSLLITALSHYRGDDLFVLHFNYGQKTQTKELDCFHKISDYYQIKPQNKKIIDLTFLSQLGGSSLTDLKIDVTHTLDSDPSDQIPTSYVPFRNTIMLSMAIAWAEVIGADRIIIGAVFEDLTGYPDCRPKYYEVFNQLIKEGTKEGKIEIETPIIKMKKSEIIKKIMQLNAPTQLSWSCYQNEIKPCMVCDSCILRQKAFQEAGIADPLY